MSFDQSNPNDPLGFMRNLWGNMGFSLPGMVAPTFDVEELDKRIKDMKAVEGWLRMNLSMLQMTIQGLEMQRTTVSAVQSMRQMATDAATKVSEATAQATANMHAPEPEPAATEAPQGGFGEAAMWPWQMMQQMREQMEQHAAQASEAVNAAAAAAAKAATVNTPAEDKPKAGSRSRKKAD